MSIASEILRKLGKSADCYEATEISPSPKAARDELQKFLNLRTSRPKWMGDVKGELKVSYDRDGSTYIINFSGVPEVYKDLLQEIRKFAVRYKIPFNGTGSFNAATVAKAKELGSPYIWISKTSSLTVFIDKPGV